MNLETLLPNIRSLDRLPALVAALGHQPLWDQVPFPLGRSRGPETAPIMVVGQTAGLPWFATPSQDPQRSAETLARRMSSRGQVCLVLALDPDARRLGLAVALYHCPSFQLDLASPLLRDWPRCTA